MSETKEVADISERWFAATQRAERAEAEIERLTAQLRQMEFSDGDAQHWRHIAERAQAEAERLTAERNAAIANAELLGWRVDRCVRDASTLTRQLEEAREALEPFAKAGEVKLCGNFRDDERCAMTDAAAHLTFGDLRRAAASRSLKQGERE